MARDARRARRLAYWILAGGVAILALAVGLAREALHVRYHAWRLESAEEPAARWESARALARLAPRRVESWYVERLSDVEESRERREEAVETRREIATPASVESLLRVGFEGFEKPTRPRVGVDLIEVDVQQLLPTDFATENSYCLGELIRIVQERSAATGSRIRRIGQRESRFISWQGRREELEAVEAQLERFVLSRRVLREKSSLFLHRLEEIARRELLDGVRNVGGDGVGQLAEIEAAVARWQIETAKLPNGDGAAPGAPNG